ERMSSRDQEFIKQLAISSSEVARVLEISRQTVSRGLRSDGDYLDTSKLAKISATAPGIFGIDSDRINRLIERFYPHYRSDLKRQTVSTQVKLSIDSDLYFCCNRLPYYMSVYKKLFFELGIYIKECSRQKLYFAFTDADVLRYSRSRLIKWLESVGAA